MTPFIYYYDINHEPCDYEIILAATVFVLYGQVDPEKIGKLFLLGATGIEHVAYCVQRRRSLDGSNTPVWDEGGKTHALFFILDNGDLVNDDGLVLEEHFTQNLKERMEA